jgi:hypothetical protein
MKDPARPAWRGDRGEAEHDAGEQADHPDREQGDHQWRLRQWSIATLPGGGTSPSSMSVGRPIKAPLGWRRTTIANAEPAASALTLATDSTVTDDELARRIRDR